MPLTSNGRAVTRIFALAKMCCEKESPAPPSGCGSGGLSRFESDLVSEVLEALDEPMLEAFAATFVEVLDAEVVIHLAAAEQVVDDDQDGMAESNGRLLLAAAGSEPTVLRGEVGAPTSAERVGRFDQ